MKLLVAFVPVLATLHFIGCEKGNNKVNNISLTGKTWKAEEIRVQFSNNSTRYYKAGVSGNIYDSDSLRFNEDNTGIYYYDGFAYNTNWRYTNAAQTKMTLVIDQSPTPVTVYLENIQVTGSSFKYAQYISSGDITYLASCTRIPN